MRRIYSVLFLMFTFMLGGCTLTLHSLFTPKDVVFDAGLAGTWETPDSSWIITPFDKKTGRYTLTTKMKNQQPGQYYATLGKVGSSRYLELLPKKPDVIHPKTFYGGHFVALRSFWKVTLKDESLALTPMSGQWLELMIKKNRLTIKFEKPEDGVLFLTASTRELQELVTQYANDAGAFPTNGPQKGLTFKRSEKRKEGALPE